MSRQSVIKTILEHANTLTQRYGYFVVGYSMPKKPGCLAPLSYAAPEIGPCLILQEATEEEYLEHWRACPGFKFKPGPGLSYYYRVMVD